MRPFVIAILTILIALVPTALASPASFAYGMLCASPGSVQCHTYEGDYGAGAIRPCDDAPPSNNLVGAFAWKAVHTADDATGAGVCDASAASTVNAVGSSYGMGQIQPCAPYPPTNNMVGALAWSVAQTAGACPLLP